MRSCPSSRRWASLFRVDMSATTPSYHPITFDRHGGKRWQRHASYAFTAHQSLVPIVGTELGAAALSLTIAFVAHGEGFVPVAVLGLEPAKNLYVAADGRWLGSYVPAAFRSYPFAELPMSDGRPVLCVDEASGLVSEVDGPLGGELFFNTDGTLAPPTRTVLDFLQEMAASRPRILMATASLQTHGLLQPWQTQVQIGATQVNVEGLYRVDEAAMGALADEAFLELRRSGALPLAYTHLVSTQNLQALGSLANEQARAVQAQQLPVTAAGELDLSFLQGDTLRFS